MTLPTFTLFIPAYQNASTIGATLESVQSQVRGLEQATEIVVVDDDSNDDTADKAIASWRIEKPLRVIRAPKHLGQWGQVNKMLHSLQGEVEWVMILHADDIVRPNWLNRLLTEVADCSPDVATVDCEFLALRPDGSIEETSAPLGPEFDLVRGDIAGVRSGFSPGAWWHCSGSAIRLEAFASVGDFIEEWDGADWEWFIRCLSKGWSIRHIREPLFLYRQSATSVSARSLAVDGDILESLEMVRKYRYALTTWQWVRFHARSFVFATRRMAGGLLRKDVSRAWRAISTLVAILRSAITPRYPR